MSAVADTLAEMGVDASELASSFISIVRAVSANGDTILGDELNTRLVWVARLSP